MSQLRAQMKMYYGQVHLALIVSRVVKSRYERETVVAEDHGPKLLVATLSFSKFVCEITL